MRRAVIIILALAAGLHAGPAALARPDSLTDEQRREILAEAQQAYDRGVAIRRDDPIGAREQFRSAADRFQVLVEDGIENGRLLYNLGNAHLQADEVGEAIANYRRAQRYLPNDERLRSNLSYARSLVRSRIAPSGQRELLDAVLILHRRLSTRSRFILFAACYGAFWIVLSIRLFHPHPAWKYPAVAVAILSLTLGASVGADLVHPANAGDGVIVADDVSLRKGNGAGFEKVFEEPLHEGVEFTRRERRADWWRIELPDSSTGWIRADQAVMIANEPTGHSDA